MGQTMTKSLLLQRTYLGLMAIAFASVAFIAGCPGAPTPPSDQPSWKLVLAELDGGLLSVSGTAADDVYVVGADPLDGPGPQVIHYDGQRWTRLNTGAAGDLWWITDRLVGDSFYMVGEQGLALRYRPTTGVFEPLETPTSATLFGVWGARPDNLFAVGGSENDPDTSGVILRFDGTIWTTEDLSAINPAGIPVLFKVWGRGDDDVYVVGARGAILHYDGTTWTPLISPTDRTLFTVHGNDDLVVACGGSQSGVIIESIGGDFSDVTPAGVLQMNGTFAAGDTVLTVGREGAVARRGASGWAGEDTGLDLDLILDFHATWVDPTGGIWAVGGNIIGEPRTLGMVVRYGTGDIGTQLVNE